MNCAIEWEPPKAVPRQSASVLIAFVVDQFLIAKEQEKGKECRELENLHQAAKPLLRLFATLPADRFSTDHLEELQRAFATGSWMNAAERERRRKHQQPIGWSLYRVNHNIGRIRSMFRWAERKGLVPRGTWHYLGTLPPLQPNHVLARQAKPTEATSFEDLQKVLPECSATVAAMLEVQWWSGMRSGEVRIMRAEDTDRTGDVWLYRPYQHKTKYRGHDRVVVLCCECQRILQPFLNRYAAGYLFRPADVPRAHRAKTDHYTRTAYCNAVGEACKRAGVKITAYGGRYATAQRLANAHGIETARAYLGQKSINITAHYARLDLELAKKAARRQSSNGELSQ